MGLTADPITWHSPLSLVLENLIVLRLPSLHSSGQAIGQPETPLPGPHVTLLLGFPLLPDTVWKPTCFFQASTSRMKHFLTHYFALHIPKGCGSSPLLCDPLFPAHPVPFNCAHLHTCSPYYTRL